MAARKSYWQRMSCRTDRDKTAIESWFDPWAVGLTAESAEILCDKETDREKKLRSIMVDKDGNKFRLTRSMNARSTSITRERLPSDGKAAVPKASAKAAGRSEPNSYSPK